MTEIVIAGESGELLTTTAAIAEGIERDHASVIRLVREHQDDLEDFGRVGFEIVPLTTAGGTQRREVARLNEPQATLLLTFMRNNEIVRAFKKRLVRTFFEMRDQLHNAPPEPEAVDTTAISRASAFAGALDAAARALGLDDNMRLLSVNQAVQKRTGVDLLSELGATHLLSPINERYMTPTELGAPVDMSAVAVNRVLRDLGYQREGRDGKGKLVWSLTDRGREAGGRMMDTGKKHGDGTAVQQLKWPESVADVLAEEAA
ncbi:Rha family transcriptional regulator [Chromohalobacter sp. TMW 2.2308]|uniref:Rha family transcriptional regulator n=1 Tax=Chromohalobacter TaxID=42054 RepID=UPI001FFD5E6C|nr:MULTISPECIES: Rha family transcriptional regulator [Chromohalobacter]MCK2042541.1 Rha family transcriptional regulator [Chromohalobacter moromii]MCT8514939.1 Rha family transcriptional regulator [Chromohalobacter sp. TMW 2.2271]